MTDAHRPIDEHLALVGRVATACGEALENHSLPPRTVDAIGATVHHRISDMFNEAEPSSLPEPSE
ncbi:hypothetical protein GCM10022254_03050 [Actinomadura meridiana]|uniref:Uncharacterized protein n=1 Tax=Actinomadura meridiana TaxID=559626 RepID=A0ABP8BRW5_9ACTN